MEGAKALVKFQENDQNGERHEWVEMSPSHENIGGNGLENCFPKIRPSMKECNLPNEMFSGICHGKEEILKVGQPVEAWTNNRWVEGMLMGSSETCLLVKLDGDSGSISLDASSVRVAPVWINEQKSWQVPLVKVEMKGHAVHKEVELNSDCLIENNPSQIVLASKSKAKTLKKTLGRCSLPCITAEEYASRSAILSSLVVAWSPLMQLISEAEPVSQSNLPGGPCSILAVGGKSGKVSFWRIHEPQNYKVTQNRDPMSGSIVGLLQAHNTWITAIGWALLVADAPSTHLLLATGACDGRVNIWLGHSEVLLESLEVNNAPFSLLKEVITVDSILVSVISLFVPVQSPHKIHLAIGKGSGSIEVWVCDISANKFDRVGSFEAHDHIVTGLAWAFDGRCLYSCSQDNSVRSWILDGNSLSEVPIPSNTPGLKSSADVPNVFDSCFGLAVSPGNLVLAVARCFDADLLNPMYQARSQKAAIEYFWIGGQQLDISHNNTSTPDFRNGAFPGFPEKELAHWERNILWSLNQKFKNLEKPLVVWDIVAALSAFKHASPKYVEHILSKWLILLTGSKLVNLSTAELLTYMLNSVPKIPSRKLHLLNIVNRHVISTQPKTNELKSLQGLYGDKKDVNNMWMELLLSSEKELRERIVGFTFAAVLNLVSQSSSSSTTTNVCKLGYWYPVGLAQMEQWFKSSKISHAKDHLRLLASEVGKLDKSILRSICGGDYVSEEKCNYCSAPVPFESPENASCQDVKSKGGVNKKKSGHKLERCAVSMRVCPLTPVWFCRSCHRWTSNLAPYTLFTMPGYPSHLNSESSSVFGVSAKPWCLFCGVLLQRLQPDFLLSPMPV